MAGDGRMTAGKSGVILSDNDIKVFHAGDYLLGVAGDASGSEMLIAATITGHNPGRLKGTIGLRADKKGRLEVYEDSWFSLNEKFASIGSGSDFALAGMDQGMDALKAVRYAIKRNAYCGGRVRSVKF
jgi:ATP-dependent protease HslVU (ClpYQ) peptidase subunit